MAGGARRDHRSGEPGAVEDGQTVAAGTVLAAIADPSLQAEIDAAQARLNDARAALTTQEAGGRPSDFTEIENNLARAKPRSGAGAEIRWRAWSGWWRSTPPPSGSGRRAR